MTERETRSRFLIVTAAVALSLLGDALLYNVLPARSGDFRVLVWQVGILLGANRLVRLVTNEIAGRLVDRHGLAPMVAALILGGLTTVSYALPLGFWWLLPARALWGACWSVIRAEGLLATMASSHAGNRGRAFAVYNAVSRLGAAGGVLLGGLLVDAAGLAPTFLVFGAITAGSAALVARRRETAGTRAPSTRALRPPSGTPAARGPSVRIARLPAGAPALWGAGLALVMVQAMVRSLTGRLVVDVILPGTGLAVGAATLTGVLLTLPELGNLLAGPAAGMLSDRIGRAGVLLGLLVLQGVLVGLVALLRSSALVTGPLGLLLFTGSAGFVTALALAGDSAPVVGRGLFLSRFTSFTDLGSALGPMVGFALYEVGGLPAVAAASLVVLSAAVVAVRTAARSPGS